MVEEVDIKNQLEAIVTSQEPKALAGIVVSLGMLVLDRGFFPDECLLCILTIIKDPRFRQLRGSWMIFRVFQENWDFLSLDQRALLLPALEESYESFENYKGCFLISEILGDLYSDERALGALTRLKSGAKEIPRSLLAHGLERLALKHSKDNLGQYALAALQAMEKDESAAVRREVNESLTRISKQ